MTNDGAEEDDRQIRGTAESHQGEAIDPLGEARRDLDILIDYAHGIGLKGKDGAPPVKWSTLVAGNRLARRSADG